jgi:hypothetical protein
MEDRMTDTAPWHHQQPKELTMSWTPTGSGGGRPSSWPTPIDPSVAKAVLTDEQVDALATYRDRLDRIVERRREEHALRAWPEFTTDGPAAADARARDRDAARSAALAGDLPPAPEIDGCVYRRRQTLRVLDALEALAVDDLTRLRSLLVGDQARLIADAWTKLDGVNASKHRSPTALRGPIETLLWALDVHDTPTPNPNDETLARVDALPFARWQIGLDAILDDLGQHVAARLDALSETAA